MEITNKPLSGKAYGHIPHLPGSRMGPGDHHCHEGQSRIATERARDKNDHITVTVKLDGSCVSVANINGDIIALVRAGYLAQSSKYEQHQLFAHWVRQNRGRFLDILPTGQRLVGEWLAQAHGTRYNLEHEPFVPFDLIGNDTNKRLPNRCMQHITHRLCLPTPFQISQSGPFSIESALRAIATPHHGEIDPVEGAVWRVERNGEVDFLVKYVRPEKVDGSYLPDISGEPTVWNWRP